MSTPKSLNPYLPESPDTERAITLVVADFSRMDCQLLADAVRRSRGFRVAGHATSSEELVAKVCTQQPDVALISARLRDGASAGLGGLRKLRGLQPQCRAVILLDDSQGEFLVEAFRNGARGAFCRDNGTSADLFQCIRCVHNGQIWVSNEGVEHIIEALMRDRSGRISKAEITGILSTREEEVSRLVAAGLSNREISEKLGLSQHTIKNYLSRIFEKLGVSNRTELVLHLLSEAKPTESESKYQTPAHRMSA